MAVGWGDGSGSVQRVVDERLALLEDFLGPDSLRCTSVRRIPPACRCHRFRRSCAGSSARLMSSARRTATRLWSAAAPDSISSPWPRTGRSLRAPRLFKWGAPPGGNCVRGLPEPAALTRRLSSSLVAVTRETPSQVRAQQDAVHDPFDSGRRTTGLRCVVAERADTTLRPCSICSRVRWPRAARSSTVAGRVDRRRPGRVGRRRATVRTRRSPRPGSPGSASQ
jgi:hypothetical protein